MVSFEDLEDLCTIGDNTEDQRLDRYPTKDDMVVATKTLICKIGTNINIERVIENVKLEKGKIEKIKFGSKKDVEEKKVGSDTDVTKAFRKNKKTKKHFFNQVTLVIKPFTERANGINTKISNNGSIQMTGPKSIEEGHQTIRAMLEYLYSYDDQIFYKKIKPMTSDISSEDTAETKDTNISDDSNGEQHTVEYFTREELNEIPIISTRCELIIVSFKLPFLIHLKKFNSILIEKYNLLSIFGTSSYPGVNTKITYDLDCKATVHTKKKKRYLCDCRDMSIFTFRTGKIIITGFETIEKIEPIFNRYIEIVKAEELNIKIDPNKCDISPQDKKSRMMEVNGKVFQIVDNF